VGGTNRARKRHALRGRGCWWLRPIRRLRAGGDSWSAASAAVCPPGPRPAGAPTPPRRRGRPALPRAPVLGPVPHVLASPLLHRLEGVVAGHDVRRQGAADGGEREGAPAGLSARRARSRHHHGTAGQRAGPLARAIEVGCARARVRGSTGRAEGPSEARGEAAPASSGRSTPGRPRGATIGCSKAPVAREPRGSRARAPLAGQCRSVLPPRSSSPHAEGSQQQRVDGGRGRGERHFDPLLVRSLQLSRLRVPCLLQRWIYDVSPGGSHTTARQLFYLKEAFLRWVHAEGSGTS
jgi:hypothetical protein